MILDEQGMERAKSLARDMVRLEKEKQSKQFEEAFNNVKNTVIEIWDDIKSVFESGLNAIFDIDNQEKERSKWHVPLKIEAPPMPDLPNINIPNARSNV